MYQLYTMKFRKQTDKKGDPFIKFERNHHGPAPKRLAGVTPEQVLMTVDPALLKKLSFRPIPFAEIGRKISAQ